MQDFDELFQIKNNDISNFIIDGKILWEQLGKPQGEFKKWFNRKINNVFTKDIDYKKEEIIMNIQGTNLKRKQLSLKFNITTTILLCKTELKQNNNAHTLLKYFSNFNKKDVVIIEPKRKEFVFSDILLKITKNLCEFIPQYRVLNGKYKIDFYDKNLKLAVEYDEHLHNYQKEQDYIRQKQIEKELACNFIRVPEGLELEGVNRIITYIINKKAIIEY